MKNTLQNGIKIMALLPGVDCNGCGGCGFEGCEACATAIIETGKVDMCPACDNETIKAIAEVLGVEPVTVEPKMAYVHCNGDAAAKERLKDLSSKIFGKRPVLCVLDDLMSDEASKSKTIMALIKDTVYKGVEHALDPTRRKVIFNGTPFNKEDILVEAVESGAWDVNVYPVCEKFPCTKEEFSGAWEDRFSYEYIANQYDLAKKTGRLDSFYQELMLRIISDDTKLVHPNEIRWYKKSVLLQSKSFYNFYITTDFATSAKQSADYSVISVWAINSNGDYFWVDGQCKRTTMNNTIDKLFELVSKYKPQSVGIEVTGQQGAFIQWLQKEMMQRNIFFSFASSGNNNAPGIRPVADKLSRFNLVVPMFKAGKFWFPEEDKDNPILKEGLQEINLATSDGLKGKDDFLDTISMLAYIKVWRPSESVPYINPENDTGLYDEDMLPIDDSTERMDSYIV